MRTLRLSGLLTGAVAVGALLLAGCQQDSIRALPNRPPVAQALVDNGDDNVAQQRLGYVINGDVARLDGSLSDDPDDSGVPYLLTFIWTFDSLPSDSEMIDEDIVVPEDDPDTEEVNEASFPSFTPDVLGTYRIQLVVLDDDDAESAPSIAVIQSVPPSDVAVTASWEDTQADLDLHLIGPGGSYFGAGDCFSWDPNPNWGESELATDNPELDSDDDGEGSGPYREAINLEAPVEGSYSVWVHYYSDHSSELGNSAVTAVPTVEVRVFDVLVEGSRLTADTPLVAGDVWKVGVLNWPERSFAPLNQMSSHTAEGGPSYND